MAIYLDYNATAPVHPKARAAWLDAQAHAWGNAGSVHGHGQSARHHLDQAKMRIAACLGCRSNELVITSGGSEANALAIHAALMASSAQIQDICASRIDHSSILRNAQNQLAHIPNARLHLLPVDHCGRLLPATVSGSVDGATGLVCLQFANNELGTLQDISALVGAVREHAPKALVLLDCCQGTGKRPIDLHALGVDFASVAGHKFGAGKGVGLLYVRNGIRIAPQIAGGRQQQDRRSGTEDVASTCAMAAALEEGVGHLAQEDARQRSVLNRCWQALKGRLPNAHWVAFDAPRLANTMSLAHPGVRNDELVTRLDLAGIEVSRGSACMATRAEPSHVIAALGLEPELAASVIRVSIGRETEEEELEAFVDAYVGEVTGIVQ